jgi:hypothetical protein
VSRLRWSRLGDMPVGERSETNATMNELTK